MKAEKNSEGSLHFSESWHWCSDKVFFHICALGGNVPFLLQGRGWWKTADDPWQTLATCMEIVDAMRSPDPAQYISHQPVHQDGSCNGLQHYAALGHDSYGAKQVNLMPADRPQDVYEEVF